MALLIIAGTTEHTQTYKFYTSCISIRILMSLPGFEQMHRSYDK